MPGVPAGVPVFVKPNAGLPNPDGSYDLDAEGFAAAMQAYAASGVSIVGGCCGTTPDYIRRLKETFAPLVPAQKIPVRASRLCSPVRCVEVGGVTVVGERINPHRQKSGCSRPCGKGTAPMPAPRRWPRPKRGPNCSMSTPGCPVSDEAATLERLVQQVQAVTDLPLQLDSTDPAALERALRVYNGKPVVNSVNGEQKSLDTVLPLCKKYGAAVVGLTLDEHGIPPTAEGRLAICAAHRRRSRRRRYPAGGRLH